MNLEDQMKERREIIEDLLKEKKDMLKQIVDAEKEKNLLGNQLKEVQTSLESSENFIRPRMFITLT